jgi:alpha-L-fucosidase
MLHRILILVFAAIPALTQQRYPANWDSLDQRPTPSWFTGAKFGIFIHWGVYSVPAFATPHEKNQNPYAEWYWNSLTLGKEAQAPTDKGAATWQFHRRVYGPDFPYTNFAPLFRAELFDPNKWADVFARSGARYVVPTSKHHEGFALWPSAEASRTWGHPWNAVEIGPHRDLLGDLTTAVRNRGLRMGFYYSLYEWYNPLWLSDKDRYVRDHMFPQFKDVVTRYQPSIIFADGEWDLPSAEWHSPELLAWLFNDTSVKDEVVINDRWGKETRHKHGGYYTTEYTAGMQTGQHAWEENRGMGYSYGYNRMETTHDYRTERELILMLVDIVSRGGNLLLDIGPTADGRIPVIMEERLLEIGDWLRINGEAIYDTIPWRVSRQWSAGSVPEFQEKEFMAEYDLNKLVDHPASGSARIDAFFSQKNGTIYVLLPRWPEGEFVIKGLQGKHPQASLLETKQSLSAHTISNGIAVRLPLFVPKGMASHDVYVVKLTGVQ